MGFGCNCYHTPRAWIKRGALGLAKAAAQSAGLRVDQAAADVIDARRDRCRACPSARPVPAGNLSHWSHCRECGCLIAAKTRLASETCPLGKW